MSEILNEQAADQQALLSALRHISKLERDQMQEIVLFKDSDGNVKRAHNFENISREDITAYIDDATAELQRWQNALSEFDALNQSDQAATPTPVEQPVDATPVTEAQPAPIAAEGTSELQPVELTVTPAADVSAPVDTSVQPQAPTPQVITDVSAPLQ